MDWLLPYLIGSVDLDLREKNLQVVFGEVLLELNNMGRLGRLS